MEQKKKTILTWVIIGSIIVAIVSSGIVYISHKVNSQSVQKKNPTKQPPKNPQNPPLPGETDECPYNEKSLATFSKHIYERAGEEDLAQWRKIPRDFVVKLWKKGYHWMDIIQLWDWQIPEPEIPDLKTEKRIGVINGLVVMPNPQIYDENLTVEEQLRIYETNPSVGRTTDLVVIVRKIPNSGKINIHKKFGFGNEDERSDRGQVRKIVNFTLQWENIDLQQCEVSIFWAIGAQRFGNEWDINIGNSSGSSGGSAIYLALLSALHQKPISRQVAATGTLIMSEQKGTVNGQEIILVPGTNLPIVGIKEKVAACAEKGINKLVLSKYQASPNLLVKKDENNPSMELTFEDYQAVIPSEIKEKMTVYWTENTPKLRDLVFSGRLS